MNLSVEALKTQRPIVLFMIAWARYPYEGTTVLVTGGGSGIGRAIAQAFLEQGACVLVTGRHADPLHETVATYPDQRAAVVVGDMATEGGVTSAVQHLLNRWGHLDVVIANAGFATAGTIDTLNDGTWEQMRSINIDGLIRLARVSVPRLRESRGTFLAISSIAGFGGDWNQAGYNATKGAVNALVQSMALDLGRDGVRVNAIAPAFTATRLTQERLDDPAFWAALRDRLALDRPAEPEDVARAALFLAGPDAAYITGIVLPVDGGTTASVGTPRPVADGQS
jgi:meso-butanediol dehydrogenase/(S,S)-butanediol dehydrogenase/diacetyl reductase